jgi:hypothetical protein
MLRRRIVSEKLHEVAKSGIHCARRIQGVGVDADLVPS